MLIELENVEESENEEVSENVDESSNDNEAENVDELSNVDVSENIVEFLDDIETKKILEVNVDDVDALESDDETVNNEQQSKFAPQRPQPSGYSRYRSPSYCLKVACHICGKLFSKYNLQFHLNRHNGKCR